MVNLSVFVFLFLINFLTSLLEVFIVSEEHLIIFFMSASSRIQLYVSLQKMVQVFHCVGFILNGQGRCKKGSEPLLIRISRTI